MTTSDRDNTIAAMPQDWWLHLVVYRLSVASFASSDDDSQPGDIRGVIDHLDYLADLGVDVIQLIGVRDLPGIGSDGTVTQYCRGDDSISCAIDDDLCRLVHAANQRRLRIFADFAPDYATVPVQLAGARSVKQLQNSLAQLAFGAGSIIALEDLGLPRSTMLCGKSGYEQPIARMLATIMMTTTKVPVIYQGQELGMVDESMIEWGDLADDSRWSVMSQDDDDSSLLNYYRQVIALRKSSLVLQNGVMQAYADKNASIFGYIRALGDDAVVVMANLSHRPTRINALIAGRLLVSSYPGRIDMSDNTLQPYEAVAVAV